MSQLSVKPACNRDRRPESAVTGAMETVLKPPVPSGSQTAVEAPLRMQVRNLNFYYGKLHALHCINLEVAANRVTALIGPSGCGKSTLIRTFNRMHETVRGTRLEGEILLDGEDIFAQDVTHLRRRIGMVFQRPNPFPKSIFENVAYGLRINGLPASQRGRLSDAVEHSLRRAALWEEVKDQLHKSAYALSGGQQQRLCIARALAVDPEVLLARRALLRARSGQYRQDRGVAVSLEAELHAGDRHPQYAAGRARQRYDGVHAQWRV